MDIRYEQQRLASFRGWPTPKISVERLAENGFFYIGREDCVKCEFCKLVLKDWLKEDNVEHEHRLHSQNKCAFLRGKTDNIALGVNPLQKKNERVDECGINRKEPQIIKRRFLREKLSEVYRLQRVIVEKQVSLCNLVSDLLILWKE